MAVSILIADDESLIRKLYTSGLSQYEDIKVVGQAANGEETMKAVKGSRPDVLLLDLHMPRMSGLDVLKKLKSEKLNVRTIVNSMHDSDELIQEAVNENAYGFLTKTEEFDEIYKAIITVAKGEFYYTNKVNATLLKIAREKKKDDLSKKKEKSGFSEKEISIVSYLNAGLTSSEIAKKLYCSRATVDRIRQNLMNRAGVRNTIELLNFINLSKSGQKTSLRTSQD